MRTIQAVWDKYQKDVLPQGCSQIQLQETRRAFYAGAAAVLGITLELAVIDIDDDAGAAIIEGLHVESANFVNDVMEGRA